jgi:PIN domain nuclease of toxin-antitoxin system
VRLLLDTHIAIWAVAESKRLPADIRDLIEDERNDIFVSVVSVWEIAMKRALGRRGSPAFSAAEAVGLFEASGYSSLSVATPHVLAVETLPHLHADPFDRLLVAQAITEPLRFVTRDRKLTAYSDTIISF